MSKETTATIRSLNDKLRVDRIGGTLVVTSGIAALGPAFFTMLMDAIRRADDFDDDNDPYGEHDFGVVTVLDQKVFWKIDYYDLDMRQGAEFPEDPALCVRVMTVMTEREY